MTDTPTTPEVLPKKGTDSLGKEYNLKESGKLATGRPRRDFDQTAFESLCKLQCTSSELSSFFKTDLRTLDDWCERIYGDSLIPVRKRFNEDGKTSLRRIQWRHASRSAVMAIWLGKVYLHYSG